MKVLKTTTGLALIALSPLVLAQKIGHTVVEKHPSFPSQFCTKTKNGLKHASQHVNKGATCVTRETSIVLDADFRHITAAGTDKECVQHGKWNKTTCSTLKQCTKICGLEGADYENDHLITTSNMTLNLKLQEKHSGDPIGSRVYMLDTTGKRYEQFKLLNREFAFDVNMSMLPCGSNAALYFSQMDADGGTFRYPSNEAGACFGTGYCDAQCQKSVNFINGEANFNNAFGSCCTEMDVWEANSKATAYTTHSCSIDCQERCESDKDCGATPETHDKGWCDKPGCDYNPYRLGQKNFYGRGPKFDIDTTRPFTVITQFLTDDHTRHGKLVEITRFYKQDNKVIANPKSTWPKLSEYDSITTGMCKASQTFFNASQADMGGLTQMGKAFAKGMTLVFSLWVDPASNMSWLDSYTGDDHTIPGAARGPCQKHGGSPRSVFDQTPTAGVTFANVRVGELGTTF